MNILVTGGAGFIGSHIVERLVSLGHNVYVIDNLSNGSIDNIQHLTNKDNFVFYKGDIRDLSLVKMILMDVEAVVHLAAIIDVQYSINNPEETNDVNVRGTLGLLKSSFQFGIKKFIYTSSCAVYGEAKYLPIDEDHPTYPLSPYAASKVASEAYIKAYSRISNLKTIILRLFNVYGPRQEVSRYPGVISKFITSAMKSEELVIYGDGTQTRDFIFVKDVTDLIVMLIEGDYPSGETYNVGSGMAISIRELAEKIINLVGRKKVKMRFSAGRIGDIKRSQAFIEKINRDLNFSPRISIDEGLRLTIEYMKGKRSY